jgi:16S rRNA (uracil1498-N3)-methyltransferase
MERFFVQRGAQDAPIYIENEDFQHATRVLRVGVGDCMEICDGAGQICHATVEAVEKTRLRLAATRWTDCDNEPQHHVRLLQCLPKAGKLEWIIQKCVELGVAEIMPIESARCVVRTSAEDFSRKHARFTRVALEAAKQSKRGVLPPVLPLHALADVDFAHFDTVLLAYEGERMQSLRSVLRRGVGRKIALCIGPEGGFAPEEVRDLQEKGAQCVSLGARILRTETAGMAALAQILYEVEP